MNPDDAGAFSNAVPSVLTLFLDAPLLVQLVIVVVLAALVWSLVVIAEKTFQYARARKEADKFEQVFWSGQALDELYQALSQRRNVGMAALFVAAMREWKRSTEGENRTPSMRPVMGVQGRVDKVMDVALTRDVERLGRRLTLLSIVASSTPLLGLFGLAWGLMAAFQAAMEQYGAAGRRVYAWSSPTLDTIFPALYVTLFVGLLVRLRPSDGWTWLAWIPVFAGVWDLCENAQITAMLLMYPDVGPTQVAWASFFTYMKNVWIGPAYQLPAVALVRAALIRGWWRRRRDRATR